MNAFLKGIGRMFTVPKSVRAELDANPEVQVVKAAVLPAAIEALSGAIDQKVSDPTANALIKAEIGHLLQSSGIAN